MEIAYYNLSGGINQSLTKTELGLDTKKIFWTDSENVEIFQNRGIIKQKGNSEFLDFGEKITGLTEISAYDEKKLLITTISGKIYIHDSNKNTTTIVNKTLTGIRPVFQGFLNGVLVITESDPLFYIKNNNNYDVINCNLKDLNNQYITDASITAYKGRVWVAKEATIYYSALGTYNNFTLANDAGYINEFHTDTGHITALKPYKDYLAIYKKNNVYLLTGTSPDDFAVIPFANKGAVSSKTLINVDNKQYFVNNGIFALEQVGELNQIQLGSEISLKIKDEFNLFENIENAIGFHYEKRNQIWYFFPYGNNEYFHTVWINDYINKAWYKRVIPQDIVTACVYDNSIYTADKNGKIYIEDYGSTFNGEPIKFMWKSPFLAITSPHHRKIIDEFYFLIDTEYDNNFNFSVYKDYDNQYPDDEDKIFSIHKNHLVWSSPDVDEMYSIWAADEGDGLIWSVNSDTMEKAEISDSNFSIQICISGSELSDSCAIIGLQFKEIYIDD